MKKQLLFLFSCCICAVGTWAWDGSIADGFAGGQGTSNDPYRITNAEQLAFLAQQVNEAHQTYYGRYFVLTNDIDLFGKNGEDTIQWTPIGIVAKDVTFKGENMNPNHHPFQGTFDGAGHTIHNLYIHLPDSTGVALFRHIRQATLKNIRFENVQVFSMNGAAALCSSSGFGSVIDNCHVLSGNIIVRYNSAGGIASSAQNYCYEAWSSYDYDRKYTYYYSVIKNCSNSADITSLCEDEKGTSIGGIVGAASGKGDDDSNNMHIVSCINRGRVSGRIGVGGICGYFSEQTNTPILLDSCRNYGDIHKKAPINWSNAVYNFGLGGVLGATSSAGYVLHCLNAGNILSDTLCSEYKEGRELPANGGIIGYAPSAKARYCVNIGHSDGIIPFGGICGSSYSNSIYACLNAGSAPDKCGGLIYKLGSYSNISNCLAVYYNDELYPSQYSNAAVAASIGYTGFPPPTNLYSTHVKKTYYDIQLNGLSHDRYANLTTDYGQRFTTQMLGESLRTDLIAEDWVFEEGMYPRPKGTEGFDIAVLAATPVFLKFKDTEEFDHICAINESFSLPEKAGVTWSTNSPLVIKDNQVYIVEAIPEDSVYSIYAHYGEATRRYDFKAKSLANLEPIDQITPNPSSTTRKVLIDGALYIVMPNGPVFTPTGQKVL